jgi:hypothetical protein
LSILSIFIGVIVLFIIFFIIFLFLGLKIYLKLNKKDNKFKAVITVKWTVINIFSKKFPIPDENKKKIENKSIEKEKKEIDQSKEKSSKKWKDFIQLYPLLKSNINPIFDYILICIDSIKLQKFDTHIIIGLSSFTDTATFTGYIWAFSTIPKLSDHFTLTAEPIFTKETIDFESEIIFKIKLLKPFLGILKLFTKKTMLKLIWNLRVLM